MKIENKIKFFILVIIFTTAQLANASAPIIGTQKSFTIAFESLLRSDGAVAEEWDIEIGKRIKTHPTNFLKALKIYRNKVKRLDAIVGNLGPEYVDDSHRQKIELQKRVQSLKSVKERTLKPLATECIEELKKRIGRINATSVYIKNTKTPP
jgi:hypothetical protein